MWPLEGFFLAFHLVLIGFEVSLMVIHYCLAKSVDDTLGHLILTLSSLYSLCKNIPLDIRTIAETKNRLVKIHIEASSLL